jgi:hypothetical protein
LPAETDLRRPAAEPICAVRAAAASQPVTIEGHITARLLIDGIAGGNTVITFDDGTDALRVLVQPDTHGNYWASHLGARVQADVLTGPTGQRQVDAILGADAARRARAPAGECALATEVRFGLQLGH